MYLGLHVHVFPNKMAANYTIIVIPINALPLPLSIPTPHPQLYPSNHNVHTLLSMGAIPTSMDQGLFNSRLTASLDTSPGLIPCIIVSTRVGHYGQ